MNLGGSFSLNVNRRGLEVVFLFLSMLLFACSRGCTLFFTVILVYIRDVIVVDVDRAFGLIDFVSGKYFNFDPHLELWIT